MRLHPLIYQEQELEQQDQQEVQQSDQESIQGDQHPVLGILGDKSIWKK